MDSREFDEHKILNIRHSKASCLKIKQKLIGGPECLKHGVPALNINSVSTPANVR